MAKEKIQFEVNGKNVFLEVDPDELFDRCAPGSPWVKRDQGQVPRQNAVPVPLSSMAGW